MSRFPGFMIFLGDDGGMCSFPNLVPGPRNEGEWVQRKAGADDGNDPLYAFRSESYGFVKSLPEQD